MSFCLQLYPEWWSDRNVYCCVAQSPFKESLLFWGLYIFFWVLWFCFRLKKFFFQVLSFCFFAPVHLQVCCSIFCILHGSFQVFPWLCYWLGRFLTDYLTMYKTCTHHHITKKLQWVRGVCVLSTPEGTRTGSGPWGPAKLCLVQITQVWDAACGFLNVLFRALWYFVERHVLCLWRPLSIHFRLLTGWPPSGAGDNGENYHYWSYLSDWHVSESGVRIGAFLGLPLCSTAGILVFLSAFGVL